MGLMADPLTVEALKRAIDDYDDPLPSHIALMRAAARRELERMEKAETPDQRAERLLGKWLVGNYGWNILVDGNRDDYRCRLRHGESDFYLYSGYGPTKAEAILDALRKAGCKDV
jgi:hypothetical protein